MFSASATLAHGVSSSGGAWGYTKVELMYGDGFWTGTPGITDNRIYLLVTFTGVGGPGSFTVTDIDWKLTSV